jgi:hypothetical protein
MSTRVNREEPTRRGLPEPGDPAGELKYFYVCKICGQAVDRRNRNDVRYHEQPDHKPLPSDA